ncbi:MAG TPA: penicillin-binding protein 1C [Prosthecobacter sp.]|mgnify:CR=1 FL=1|nr:penicillin-binding protein 1C [Prosthecobacter sp.]HRK15178.1 penicillin-binding protein 1C [Prosthecobacter sp.]
MERIAHRDGPRAGFRILPAAASAARKGLAVVVVCVSGYALLPRTELYPPEFRFSRALEDRDGRLLHLALTPDGKYRRCTPLAEISPALIEATLTLEDRHFYGHPGVNPLSLLRAAWGAVSGSAKGGGSTITMQLARLRHGLRTRTPWGKAWQIVRAVQMERHHSKDEILEAYLNQAPYGGNVEGAGAAALLWCGKTARELTLREAVTLAVLPQSPTTRRPRMSGENASLAAAQHRLWERLRVERGLPADPLDAVFTLWQARPAPREAPHLARRLFTLHEPHDRAASGAPVRCTLSVEKQRGVERALQDYVERKREVGITNACALLVHAPSREVLAYAGSSRFLDPSIQGQVDGVTARRSPGSALKPFIYALALQEGLIHPRTLLRDGRTAFGAYNPENFDRNFAGPISAQDALFHSRNIPAVALAQKLAPPGLYGFLKAAGVALPRPAGHYGLALPLGGGEVSMEELAELYSLLADDGRARRLSLQPGGELEHQSRPLITAEARHLTRMMLSAREADPAMDDPSVMWKTGTSHGFRDAWAAGIRGNYVLVVWIGNFNGKANPAFIARECAAPLLFEVFRHLRLPARADPPPPGVARVELCAVSGQLPVPHCRHRARGGFIPGVSPITPCAIHREVLVDAASGLRVARDDGSRALRREVFEFWPPDLLEMFRQAGVPRRTPPPLEFDSDSLAAADIAAPPKILSPRAALVYTLRASEPARQTIPLRADTAPGVARVFWFAGPRFLGASDPATPLLWSASPGRWQVHVLDDHGRGAAVEARVEMVP